MRLLNCIVLFDVMLAVLYNCVLPFQPQMVYSDRHLNWLTSDTELSFWRVSDQVQCL